MAALSQDEGIGMVRAVIASGNERTMLARVMQARQQGRALIVPPANVAEPPAFEVPEGYMVAFTSGSTGARRGILRSHESWSASLDPLTAVMGLRPTDRVCVLGSLHATMALYGAIHAMHVTGEVILVDEPRAEATVAHAVPAAAEELLANPPAALRLVVVAGDRVPTFLRALAKDRGIELLEYYGATELSFVAYGSRATELKSLAPFPGVEIAIEDGEIWARSPFLAEGYVGTQDGPGRWRDGWATVGDRGSWVDGRLIVDGRGDAAATVAGHTVHLDDVEAFLHERCRAASSGVVDLAVTVVAHGSLGSVLVGVVAGDRVEGDALREMARDLPGPARPRRWIMVRQLPRTDAGKIDRSALRLLAQDA